MVPRFSAQSVQSIMGATENFKPLKSLMNKSFQSLGANRTLPHFASWLAFSPLFGTDLRPSRKSEGQVANMGTIDKRNDGTGV
jgi:hypothetical protein